MSVAFANLQKSNPKHFHSSCLAQSRRRHSSLGDWAQAAFKANQNPFMLYNNKMSIEIASDAALATIFQHNQASSIQSPPNQPKIQTITLSL